MAVWVGTSGYNYPEWRGSFYPEDMPESKMLSYYSARFSTVEINYSFYRMPNERTIAGWVGETPDGFSFTLKAPRRITHDARLEDCEDLLAVFCQRAKLLGPKRGVLLFQLAPSFRKKLDVFDRFLAWLPKGVRAAFEFRNASWLTDEVYERLRARNLALCVTDNEKATTPVVVTADYGYFRLRDEGYTEADLAAWAKTIQEHQTAWGDVYVYFKHEEAGIGPAFARSMLEHLGLPAPA
jgi:uncharacterized protein YecE (DUF72 family)